MKTHNHITKFTQLTLAGLLGLLSMGVMAQSGFIQNSANNPALSPTASRITEAVQHRDQGVYRATQSRIKALNDRGIRVDNYHLSKAQCWLDVSFHEYTRNDRGGFPQPALEESQKLISALEANQTPGMETPLVNNAEYLRDDLWKRAQVLKNLSPVGQRPFQCGEQATACAEVELVHAGNEIKQAGWRHAKPYIQIAEDLLQRAEEQVKNCNPPPAPPAPPAQPVCPPTYERVTLGSDTLFYFDRSARKDILPGGVERLRELVARLDSVYSRIDVLRVIGHTDRMASHEYNDRLSFARATTISAILRDELGVRIPISVEGRGERQPVKADALCPGEAVRGRVPEPLRACLQPNRRVEIEIMGVRKDAQCRQN